MEEVAASIASELRGKIEAETGLTASAGIACNKRLAKVEISKNTLFFELFCVKVASDMKKPNGQLVVTFNEEEVGKFARRLNIRKVALCFCLIKGA